MSILAISSQKFSMGKKLLSFLREHCKARITESSYILVKSIFAALKSRKKNKMEGENSKFLSRSQKKKNKKQ